MIALKTAFRSCVVSPQVRIPPTLFFDPFLYKKPHFVVVALRHTFDDKLSDFSLKMTHICHDYENKFFGPFTKIGKKSKKCPIFVPDFGGFVPKNGRFVPNGKFSKRAINVDNKLTK